MEWSLALPEGRWGRHHPESDGRQPRMIDIVEAHIWRLRSEGVAFVSRLYLGRGASVALQKEGQT